MSMLTDDFWKSVDNFLDGTPETEYSVLELMTRGAEAFNSGNFRRMMFESAAAWRLGTRVLGPEHPVTANIMGNLGWALYLLNDLANAARLCLAAYEILRSKLGDDHSDSLVNIVRIASIYRASGDYTTAVNLHTQALETYRRVLGPEQLPTIACMNECVETLLARGDLVCARSLSSEAIEIGQRVLGHKHPHTLASMNEYGVVLRRIGDLARAEAMHQKVHKIRCSELGSDHPATLISLNNLAETVLARSDLVGGEAMLRDAIEIARSVLGIEHPLTLTQMSNLAMTLTHRGDFHGADVVQREVFEIRRSVLGPEHPITLNTASNVALAHVRCGNFTVAKSIQRDVLDIRRRILGHAHPNTLNSMNNLAETLRDCGNLTGAAAMMRETVELCDRTLGPNQEGTIASKNNLASMLRDLGDLAEAEAIQREVLNTAVRVLGSEHHNTLTYMINLAMTLQARGELGGFEESSQLLGEVSMAIERLRGSGGNDVGKAMLAGKLGAGPVNISLASLLARLGSPVDEVLVALERGCGRTALDVLNRGGRGAIELAREQLSTEELEAYENAGKNYTELRLHRNQLEQQLQQGIADMQRIQMHNNPTSGQLAISMDELKAHSDNLFTEVRQISDRMGSAAHQLRVFERKILPESSIRGLDEIYPALRPGELLMSLGYCWRSAVAVFILHGENPSALTLSEDENELANLSTISTLITLSISPDWRHAPIARAAIDKIVGNVKLVASLGDLAIEDCTDRVERLERIVTEYERELTDARKQARPVNEQLIKGILSQPVPPLPWSTLCALSHELLRVLIPNEIRAAMAKAERVIVVPSGPLHDLPLSLLIEAAGIEELIDTPITYTPSASTFALQRQNDHLEGDGLSIAGDPDFGPQETDEDADDDGMIATPKIRDTQTGHMRLPRTRTEAQQIEGLFRKAGHSDSVMLLGNEATLPRVRATAPGRRFVHLASHAVLGRADDPMLSSVVLAPPSTPSAENTGYLTLEELIGRWGGRLRGCKLVVLSACQSSVGVEVGDSRMAMPLGFLHAGAKSVLASLWSVPDVPTWLLMRRFYENLLGVRHDDTNSGTRTGHGCSYEVGCPMPATAALAEAQHWLRLVTLKEVTAELDEAGDITTDESKQMKQLKSDEVLYPFEPALNWAAFVLIGDADPN